MNQVKEDLVGQEEFKEIPVSCWTPDYLSLVHQSSKEKNVVIFINIIYSQT
jgi:hypothetical protein